MNLKLQRALSVFPVFDWYLNIRYNPWKIPSRHRNIALLEHTFLYGSLGFVASFLFGFKYAILLFIVLAIITTLIEILLAMKGIKPWNFLKGKKKTYVYSLFLCMITNVLIYYTIGGLFALYLNI